MIRTWTKDGKTWAKRTDLTIWADNPKEIMRDRFEDLKAYVREYGQFKPLIVTSTGIVAGGNSRMEAYAQLGIEDIWVSVVDIDNPRQLFRLAMADNDQAGQIVEQKLAEMAIKYEVTQVEAQHIRIQSEVKTIEAVVSDFAPDGKDDRKEPKAQMVRCPDCSHEFDAKGARA